MQQHWFRWRLLRGEAKPLRLRRLNGRDAEALAQAIHVVAFAPAVAEAERWGCSLAELTATGLRDGRWISAEAVDALVSVRPNPGLLDRVRAARCQESFTADQIKAMAALNADISEVVAETNETILASELVTNPSFFDTSGQAAHADKPENQSRSRERYPPWCPQTSGIERRRHAPRRASRNHLQLSPSADRSYSA